MAAARLSHVVVVMMHCPHVAVVRLTDKSLHDIDHSENFLIVVDHAGFCPPAVVITAGKPPGSALRESGPLHCRLRMEPAAEGHPQIYEQHNAQAIVITITITIVISSFKIVIVFSLRCNPATPRTSSKHAKTRTVFNLRPSTSDDPGALNRVSKP